MTESWNREYIGDAHLNLLKNIERSLNISAQPYSNSSAIIQSSGYGKPRTVDQLATLVPTIPINVRPVQETTTAGAFPPPDAVLNEFFAQLATSYKSDQAIIRIQVFLKILFTCYTELVKTLKNSTNPRTGENNPAELATLIRTYLQDSNNRSGLYEKVVATFWESLTIPPNFSHTIDARNALAALVDELGRTNCKPGLIIYFDEAHTLTEMELKLPSLTSGQEVKETMYSLMLKAVAEHGLDSQLCALFLSTASQLAILKTPDSLPRSFRFEQAKARLMTPFTEMPFDCHPSLTSPDKEVRPSIKPGLMLKDVQDFGFMVRFGRPLFWTYYESLIDSNQNLRHAMVQVQTLAKKKLTGLSEPDTWDSEKNVNRGTIALAILDVVLNLQYDPIKDHNLNIASKLVAGYMRTAFSIPANRTYMHTGYPSEPVLAEAALDLIYCKKDTKSMATMLLAVDQNTSGAIDKGERSENVGKMLLLTAYMNAVASEAGPDPPAWRKGCSLISFLKHLAAETHHEIILNNCPDFGINEITMNEAYKNSWVRFTHFVRAADDSAMTSSMSWVAFVREMAIIGWPSQESVDFQLAILLDINKPISEANMSALFLQLKVRDRRSGKSTVAVSAEKIVYFPPPESCRDPFRNGTLGDEEDEKRKAHRSRPYISLVMELGVCGGGEKTSILRKVVESCLDKCTPVVDKKTHTAQKPSIVELGIALEARKSTRKKTQNTDHPRNSNHPRYSLFFYGCSHNVYRVISPSSQDYKNLLHVNSIFDDHPTGRPIEPVLAMKPYWKAGSSCFSWIDEPYFKGLPEEMPTEVEEGATVIAGVPMDVDDPDYSSPGIPSDDMIVDS